MTEKDSERKKTGYEEDKKIFSVPRNSKKGARYVAHLSFPLSSPTGFYSCVSQVGRVSSDTGT